MLITKQFGLVGAHLLFCFAVFAFFSLQKWTCIWMPASDLRESEHGALVWLKLPLNVKALPLLLDLLLVTTRLYVLSVCYLPLPFHFPALTPPVSAVCSARRVGQPRSLQRWKHPWMSSTTHPLLRFSRPSRRRAAPCSSCPVTRAKPLISSMRSEYDSKTLS